MKFRFRKRTKFAPKLVTIPNLSNKNSSCLTNLKTKTRQNGQNLISNDEFEINSTVIRPHKIKNDNCHGPGWLS
jgi:hypothetical protein